MLNMVWPWAQSKGSVNLSFFLFFLGFSKVSEHGERIWGHSAGVKTDSILSPRQLALFSLPDPFFVGPWERVGPVVPFLFSSLNFSLLLPLGHVGFPFPLRSTWHMVFHRKTLLLKLLSASRG